MWAAYWQSERHDSALGKEGVTISWPIGKVKDITARWVTRVEQSAQHPSLPLTPWAGWGIAGWGFQTGRSQQLRHGWPNAIQAGGVRVLSEEEG